MNNSVSSTTMVQSSPTAPNTKVGTITVIPVTNDTLRIIVPYGHDLKNTLKALNFGIVASYNRVTGYFTFSCTTSGNIFPFLSTLGLTSTKIAAV